MLPSPFITKDSGAREEFPTGAKRDTAEGKGSYHLLSPLAIRRLAQLLQRGAKKYDERNWEKGMKQSRFIDSGLRHAFNYLEGDREEDHLAAAMWNFACAIHQDEMVKRGLMPADLLDVPSYLEKPQSVPQTPDASPVDSCGPSSSVKSGSGSTPNGDTSPPAGMLKRLDGTRQTPPLLSPHRFF